MRHYHSESLQRQLEQLQCPKMQRTFGAFHEQYQSLFGFGSVAVPVAQVDGVVQSSILELNKALLCLSWRWRSSLTSRYTFSAYQQMKPISKRKNINRSIATIIFVMSSVFIWNRYKVKQTSIIIRWLALKWRISLV